MQITLITSHFIKLRLNWVSTIIIFEILKVCWNLMLLKVLPSPHLGHFCVICNCG